MFDLVKATLQKYGLKVEFIVAQCYDGAATMSGIHNGVAAKFRQLNEMAIFVHCHAHKLNLALQDACKNDSSIRDCLDLISSLATFINDSAKRHALFKHLQDPKHATTLKQLCETRWASRSRALKAVKQSFPAIMTFLKVIFLLIEFLYRNPY